MNFPFNIYALGFLGAFATTLASLPLWRAVCLRMGLVDDPGHRKVHAESIPLAGGFAVLTGLLLPLACGILFLKLNLTFGDRAVPSRFALEYGFNQRTLQVLAIACGAVGMVLLGWFDDRLDLRPAVKFSGQLVIAVFVAAAGVRITLFVESMAFSFGATVLWILTLTNAMNFMDNMDGLCTGTGLIASWCFGWLAAVGGQYLVATQAFLISGALFGFLPHNFPRARAFLGDTGSHLIGYLLAVLAILPHFYTAEKPRPLAVLIPLLVLAVPLIDLACVVLIRWRLGKPFYLGDTNHLSHRLVRRGFSKTTAVLLIWLLSAIAGGLAVIL